MLLEGNTLPNCNYEAKKILCWMGVESKKIHACPIGGILNKKDFELLKSCMRCGSSRYKLKQKDNDTIEEIEKHGPPMKVMWYLPIIPMMKGLFANPYDAKNLRWHTVERKCEGMYRHLAYSFQWKKFDDEILEFDKESRNIRLGLATEGMNSFGNMSTNHSSWPILLVIYNISPRLCMKKKYMMLSMMIFGPRQLGNDIDVYLSLLFEDLKLVRD